MALALVATLATGCVRRELTITSEPPGALVYLNDQEYGRTPVKRPFTFYGVYDVVIRLEGHETLKAKSPVVAPWWQWVPFDLFAEALPLTDRQTLHFVLTPTTEKQTSAEELLGRADQMRDMLEGPRMTSDTPPAPTTAPSSADSAANSP